MPPSESNRERYFVRNFRRLPPLLQVASLLGLLVALVSIAVLIEALLMSLLSAPPHWSADGSRLLAIGLNLGMLSGACSFAVNSYSLRFRRPDGGTFALESWQSQVRAIALLAALPLGALVLVLVVPLSFPTDFLAIGLTLLAAVVLLVAHLSDAVEASRRPQ
jgi:hypothetical protein